MLSIFKFSKNGDAGRSCLAIFFTATLWTGLAGVAQSKDGAPFLHLWESERPFPKAEEISFPEGIEYRIVENGLTDSYRFLHDTAISVFQNEIFTAWYACPVGEMIGDSRIRGRRSTDDGKTWSELETLVWDEKGENKMFVPAQFFPFGNDLFLLVGVMEGGPDLITACYLYRFSAETGKWTKCAEIADRFLPLGAPIRLENGNWLIPGRVSDQIGQQPHIPAIALSSGDSIASPWRVKRLVDRRYFAPCPETSVFADGKELLAIVRMEREPFQRLFFSSDYGETWRETENRFFPMSSAKTYALTLSNGTRCLFFSLPDFQRNPDGSLPKDLNFGWGTRRTLAMAVAGANEDSFSRVFKIQSDEHGVSNAYYPCAVERDGKLFVVFTAEIDGRRHCQAAVFAIRSIE